MVIFLPFEEINQLGTVQLCAVHKVQCIGREKRSHVKPTNKYLKPPLKGSPSQAYQLRNDYLHPILVLPDRRSYYNNYNRALSLSYRLFIPRPRIGEECGCYLKWFQFHSSRARLINYARVVIFHNVTQALSHAIASESTSLAQRCIGSTTKRLHCPHRWGTLILRHFQT